MLAKNNLTSGQLAYLEKYSIDLETPNSPAAGISDASAASNESQTVSYEYTVKGRTTFGELIQWGIPQEIIENLVGASLPDPATALKDYASARGLNFKTFRPALQAEVDKVKP